MGLLYILSGLGLGAAATYFILLAQNRSRYPLSREHKEELETKITHVEIDRRVAEEKFLHLQEEHSRLLESVKEKDKDTLQLSTTLATRESEYRALLEKLKDQKKEVEELHDKLNVQFKNLANEILEEKSKKFTDQNKLQISEILNPLKEKISEFEKKVEQTNKENIDRHASLKEQIVSLKELNQRITQDAENLTRALKGDSKSQGTWGEFILEKILERSGLIKNQEYFTQESHVSEDGRRLQPDVIVKLPEGKNIIIDSKVSLVAYERFVNTDDENEKKEHIKNHILSIRNHIKSLSEKNYQDLPVNSLDFVLLFMPVEPAFGVALQHDERLFQDAYDRNILIVNPSTLLVALRMVANLWRQEYQNRNAMEIAKQGGDLYDKFKNFTDDLLQLGTKLSSTQKTYDDAMKKLSTGTGNLVTRAERLKKLGAKVKNNLDSKLLGEEENGSE